jgi:hypothetical protein
MRTNKLVILGAPNFLYYLLKVQISRNNPSDQLMSKLSTACYVIRSVKPCMTQETLRVISFSYGHSIFTYDIIIWGNSSYCDIFKVQKRIIRVITNSRNGDSCHTLFKKLNILPLK